MAFRLRIIPTFVVSLSLASIWASSSQPTSAGVPTPGNILVSTNNTVTEYTRDGMVVQSFSVPQPAGESIRDIAIDREGNIRVYNGTFDPTMGIIQVATGTVTNVSVPGWSTVNNLTYGGIASFQDTIFVTDMRTSGDGGADEARGILAIDGTKVRRFAWEIDAIDLNIGLDGWLYALTPGGSPGGSTVAVYDPVTLLKVDDIDLSISTGHGAQRRAIAVNGYGELFVATLDGELFHLDPKGQLLAVETFSCDGRQCRFSDVDLAADGTLLLSSGDGYVLTTDESMLQARFLIRDGAFGERFASFVAPPLSAPSVEQSTEVKLVDF
ncbi:MAG: hypothetical protein AAF974_01405 [Cyanobacteria bacterium P01_E01_bin.34]